MTTPGQVAPDGAYIIGGGPYKYGQSLQEDFVRNLMMGGLRNISLGNFADAIPLFEGALRRLPLDALRMTKPFLLGTTDADYADVDTAVATIMRSLKVKEVFLTLGAAQSLLDKLVSDIVKIFTGHANGLDALDQWWKDLSGLLGLLTQPDQLLATLQGLLNTVWTLLTGVVNHPDKTLADVVDALTLWFTNTFDALTNLVTNLGTNFQLFLDGLGSIFGLTGAGKTVAEAVQAISDWLTTVFKPVVDGLADVVKTVTDLINGFFKLFGGTGTVNLGAMLTAATAWMTNWQKFVDGIWAAFTGGVAGAGKTVTEALTAVTGWFGGVFQKLIDGINALASFIPGFSAGSNPIQNAVDIISGILGIGQSAAASAAQANLGVAVIVAGQNGGGHDDFDYSVSASLPSPWVSTYTGNATSKLGPTGTGYLVWKYSGLVNTWREVHYRKSDVTMPNSDCIITAVLSKAPGNGSTDHSKLFIEALWSATDESRLRVQIGPNYAQLQSVSATGTVSNVGAKHAIPNVHSGDSFALKIRGNDVSLMTGTITHFTETRLWLSSFTGRQFGFGVMTAGWLPGAPPDRVQPGAELTGITWQN